MKGMDGSRLRCVLLDCVVAIESRTVQLVLKWYW